MSPRSIKHLQEMSRKHAGMNTGSWYRRFAMAPCVRGRGQKPGQERAVREYRRTMTGSVLRRVG